MNRPSPEGKPALRLAGQTGPPGLAPAAPLRPGSAIRAESGSNQSTYPNGTPTRVNVDGPNAAGVPQPRSGGDPASDGPLGIYGETRATPPLTSPKWRLQTVARSILPHNKNLAKCHRTPRTKTVDVWRSPLRGTAAYRGLCTCQQVWACPVCSARIAAHRAGEITDAINQWTAQGGSVLLLTFTAAHTRDDALRDLLGAHKDAHARFWRQMAVRHALRDLGSVGRVSATEVTFGSATGWHPHKHVLLFIKTPQPLDDPSRVSSRLAPVWTRCAAAAGLDASLSRGLDVRGGDAAGSYVTKLGLEVALAVRKKGRGSDRYGVWQLLELAPLPLARAAFAEYATVMRGTRHLVWSRGLKDRFSINDTTDAEILDSGGDQDEQLFASLTQSLWRGVARNEIRGELLTLLGIDDLEQARHLLLAFGLDPSGLTTHNQFDMMELQ